VRAGKVRAIGLSKQCGPLSGALTRNQPIAALQTSIALEPDPEAVCSARADLGIAFVAYSPLDEAS
jgi:aryl-alcohol dehydrogenase-like predicted oxidoreductase